MIKYNNKTETISIYSNHEVHKVQIRRRATKMLSVCAALDGVVQGAWVPIDVTNIDQAVCRFNKLIMPHNLRLQSKHGCFVRIIPTDS